MKSADELQQAIEKEKLKLEPLATALYKAQIEYDEQKEVLNTLESELYDLQYSGDGMSTVQAYLASITLKEDLEPTIVKRGRKPSYAE